MTFCMKRGRASDTQSPHCFSRAPCSPWYFSSPGPLSEVFQLLPEFLHYLIRKFFFEPAKPPKILAKTDEVRPPRSLSIFLFSCFSSLVTITSLLPPLSKVGLPFGELASLWRNSALFAEISGAPNIFINAMIAGDLGPPDRLNSPPSSLQLWS